MNTEREKKEGIADDDLIAKRNIRKKENIRRLRRSLIFAFIMYGTYCGMLLVEGMMLGGGLYKGLVSLITGSALVLSFYILVTVFPHDFYMPLYICTGAQILFIIVGSYLHELEFYFIIMFLSVGIISILKNFKLLAVQVSVMIFINILAFIFLVPHLDWLNHYRFFTQFILFIFGSAFMLIIIRSTVRKDSDADQAFLSFSSLLRTTPNYMLITDANNNVRYISEPMLRFANFLRREFTAGQHLIDLFHDKSLKLMFADIINADGFFETVVKINIDGEERHFKIISDKLSGEYGGKFIDISDITSIEKSRLVAEEAQNRAEIANYSKSKFLATMSHEIRTPMNAIIGISEIELDRDDNPPEIKESFSRIYNSGYTLLGIINDILDLSKIETGKLELVPIRYNLVNLLNDTIQLNMMRIGSKPIEFALRVSENLPLELFGDDLRIKQILNNLLSNAIKYTGEGVVALDVDSQREHGEVRLILKVHDTGQGMTQEQLAKLFDIYSQFNREANRTIEGTGLGMSITKNLVDMMNGSITVKSEVGIGSVFTVEVMQQSVGNDVIGGARAEDLRKFRTVEKSQMKQLQVSREYMPYASVLIVDDVETNLFVAKGLLLPYGLNTDLVTSGFDAIDKIRDGAVYDIVFMDHMMPVMDGISATKLIRQAGYTHPIVALTANAVVGQAEIFLENGFDDFISKPIDLRQLDAILNKLIRDRKPPEVVEEARRQKNSKDLNSKSSPSQTALHTLPAIRGVNVKSGIAMTGGTLAGYYKVLSMFQKDSNDRLVIMQNPPDDEEKLVSFITQVHALKSASATIGAVKISQEASLLEAAGIGGDMPFIRENLPAFAEHLTELIKEINAALHQDNETEIETDISIYISIFNELLEALKLKKVLDIERILSELEQKELDSKTKDIVEQISEHILLTEYGGAIKIIEKLLAAIS